jgi:type I restriction enzyme R subunit
MVGRGTRLAENKLMFTIYDYTDATRLFGEDFLTKAKKPSESSGGGVPSDPPIIISPDGFEAEVSDAGRYVLTEENGQIKRVSIEEFKQGLARQLLANTTTLDEFREKWINRTERQNMLDDLVRSNYSPEIVRQVEKLTEYDLFDVLADLAYGVAPHKRTDRVLNFNSKQRSWLNTLPEQTKAVVLAIAAQFGRGGTEELESGEIFNVATVRAAGGLAALKLGGNPAELITETKRRLFAA